MGGRVQNNLEVDRAVRHRGFPKGPAPATRYAPAHSASCARAGMATIAGACLAAACLGHLPGHLSTSARLYAAEEPAQGAEPVKGAAPVKGDEDQPDAQKPDAQKDDKKDDKKTDQQDAKKKGPPKPVNPLIDLLIRGAKPGKSRPPIKMPDLPDTPANKKPARASIDPRAPYDKRSDDWLRKAVAHISAGEWKEALELLQKITDLPEDTLYHTAASKQAPHWVSMRDEAQRLRGEAPPEFLEQYRVQYGGLARQLLAEAARTGDLAACGRVARSYFHTAAGYEAANRIGSQHLDRGEFALAAHWFAAIWRAHPGLAKEPLWRAKAAFAFKQAGQPELSREIFDESTASLPGSSAGLGGHAREAGKWLAATPPIAEPIESALTDWPLFYGSPRRTGVAAGGEPLLLPRWRIATTDRHPVQTQIEHLMEDLADHGTTPLPMLFPTMVGGKVVFRTLHGVQVVDAATGRLLWQTDEIQPLEKLIAASFGQADAGNDGGFFPGMMMQRGGRIWNNNGLSNGTGIETSPLCNLLFRNANFGLISSDGSRLFVVDDPLFFTNRQPGVPSGWDGTTNNNPVNSAARLAAYDLETGHPLWEVGGPANGEPFDLPLAGYFFFGAPVAEGGDLFVVGESTVGDSSGQIRLLCLDPRTGQVKWTQLVAASEVGIEKDVGRRWWTAQVAVADGLVICPTTVGWLMAVDRVTHSLLWGYRPTVPGQRANPNAFGNDNESTQMVPHTALNAAWGPAPPIVVAGRVIYTPNDAPPAGAQVIVCLDQASGKELWRKPRGHSQFLAGVFDKLAVVVGRDMVTAYRIDDGAQAWAAKITPPSGRGVTVADHLYLPLAAGEVWSIDLANGKVVSQWNLPAHAASLGNLAMYQGMLLSADAFGLTAFEQREAVQNEIARRKRENPRDPWALTREAEIELLARNVPASLAALRQVPRDELSVEWRESHRALLVRVLLQSIRADLSRPSTAADLADLATAVATPEERHDLRSLQAELLVSRHEYEQAFDVYLASAGDAGVLVPRDDAPAVRVRSDLWAAGKIAELRQSLPDEARSTIDRRIAALQPQADAPDQARLRFITLFRDSPQAAVVRRDLAEVYARRGDFLPAENLLLQIVRQADRPAAADALARLARLMAEYKLPADAAYFYSSLERRFGDVTLPAGGKGAGETGAQLVKTLRDTGKFPDAPPAVLDWQSDAVRVERIGAGFSNHMTQELASLGSPLPFFAMHRLEVEQSSQRLEVIDGMNDAMHWSLPLRSKAGAAEAGFTSAQASGHQLTLLSRGMLHSLSPVDRKILWTRPIENRGLGQNVFGRNQAPLQPMTKTINIVKGQPGLQAVPAVSAALCLVNDQFVGYQGRRNLTLLDALSGEVCWVYTGVRPGTLVLGGDEVIYLRPAEGVNPIALRVSDGRRIEVKNLADTLNRAVHVVGDNFVLTALADGTGLGQGKGGLRLFDPIQGRDLWSIELPRDTVMTVLDNDRMAVLEIDAKPSPQPGGKSGGQPAGKFAVIDLASGKRQELAIIAAEDLKGRNEVYVVTDNDSLFLLINKGQNQNYYSEQVPFVRANGVLLAFDMASGKQRWRQPVTGQNLMLERLAFSPYLVFSSRKFEQKGRLNLWSLQLLVIDKHSGTRLLDEKSSAQPGFRSITISTSDRYIELRSYQERVRIYPIDKSASAGQSGG